jgi:23S rRNA (uracil1939-C5)-methyltransferase
MALPSGHDAALLQEFAAQNAVTVYLQCGEQGAVEYYCGEKRELVSTHVASNSSLVCMPGDFLQGNALVNEQLVGAVLAALQPKQDDALLEAFCGLGNFTFPLSKAVGHITAVELGEAMLLRARTQSAAAGIGNINWLPGNLDRFDECHWDLPAFNKILLDPPRDGAQDFCKKIGLKGVESIVYVSCNPSTLARDAAILAERGFALHSVQLVDMFPQTPHIEALSVFRWDESLLRKAKKQKVMEGKSLQKRLKR